MVVGGGKVSDKKFHDEKVKPNRVSLVTMSLAESATKGTFHGINGRFLGINVKGKTHYSSVMVH
jgi:hypothetical protein